MTEPSDVAVRGNLGVDKPFHELAGALSLSRLVYYKAKFSKDSFIPKVKNGIFGLLPFNPGIFTRFGGNKESELLDDEMKRLFELSINTCWFRIACSD